MNVIFDTNILMNTNDFHCNSDEFKFLFDNIFLSFSSYYIPQICIDELVNKYKNEICKKYHEIQKLIRKLGFEINSEQFSRLQINKTVDKFYSEINDCIKKSNNRLELNNSIQVEIEKNVEDYRNYIEKLFTSHRIQILSYPSINHESIVERIFKKLKPFDQNENGYRDYIIWCTIKELMLFDEFCYEYIFITNNKKDFCRNDNPLYIHPDYINDIPPFKEILIYTSLAQYTQKHMVNYDEIIQSFGKINSKEKLISLHQTELFNNIIDVLNSEIVLDALFKEDSKRGIFHILDYIVIKTNFLLSPETEPSDESEIAITVQINFQFNIKSDMSTYTYLQYTNDTITDQINHCDIITTCQYLKIVSHYEKVYIYDEERYNHKIRQASVINEENHRYVR